MHLTVFILALGFLVQRVDPPKFEAQVLDDNVAIGYGLAIGDVDGDRKPDILLADKKQFVWYRNGDWKRFVMVEDLTTSDNVCIAARDIDGDGRVEVAVGAQWNPGETSDTVKSGSVHYLIRPKDPTQKWKPVQLHHEPTTHRMRWVKASGNKFHLVVLPLHGRGNKGGEGKGVRIFAYEKPSNPEKTWKLQLLDDSMHLTHNLDVVPHGDGEMIYIGGREGIKAFTFRDNKWVAPASGAWLVQNESFGEVRAGGSKFVAGVQPMHGTELTVYTPADNTSISFTGQTALTRTVLLSGINQGHALATADMTGSGKLQIVMGWREPDKDGKVGVKLFVPEDEKGTAWQSHWIDDNGMACEDLQVADLNADGKPEIIAAGRATRNLKIYWNRN
ncbi:MAG: VCBS repeat-containing protein [Chryseosolibacter sp.]